MSYLPTIIGEDICEFPIRTRDVTQIEDLPDGRLKRVLRAEFESRNFVDILAEIPTLERPLAMGQKTPPPSAGIFLAHAAIYRGIRNEFDRTAQQSRFWTDCYGRSPRDVARISLTINWTCACSVGDAIYPALSYIARIAQLAGVAVFLHRGI